MPLDDVSRRYAENLFQSRSEEIIKQQQAKLAQVRADHAKRNMVSSGGHIAAQARVLVEQVQLLGEVRADSLLKAYEKAGLPYDDAALNEIKTEVMEFCHQQQHYAVAAIGRTIGPGFGGQGPPGLQEAVVNDIVNGVSDIMSRLARSLSIKRDEAILDTPNFANASRTKLRWYIDNFPSPHPFFQCAMAALEKKEAEDDLRGANQPTIHIQNSNVANLNLGAQVGTINAALQTISGGDAAQQELARAIEQLTEAVLQATLPATDKQDIVDALSTIAEQGAKKPEERSKGTLKAVMAWLPTAISAANNLTTLWDKLGAVIKAHLGI